MRVFNWRRSLLALAVGGVFIGVWFLLETTVPLNAIMRGTSGIATPPDAVIVVMSFLMLLGVMLVSIQVAAIFEELLKPHEEK